MRHAQDVPLAGADPVVWYSFGVTHVVRVEDFPIMPVEVSGTAVLHTAAALRCAATCTPDCALDVRSAGCADER